MEIFSHLFKIEKFKIQESRGVKALLSTFKFYKRDRKLSDLNAFDFFFKTKQKFRAIA